MPTVLARRPSDRGGLAIARGVRRLPCPAVCAVWSFPEKAKRQRRSSVRFVV